MNSSSYKLIPIESDSFAIAFSEEAFQFTNLQTINITFGQKTGVATILAATNLQSNEIGLSYPLMKELGIPIQPKYELTIYKNNIIIGPFIGVLIAHTTERLLRKSSRLNQFIKDYDKINGCIIAFSVDGIHKKTEKITGLMYNPATKNWIETTSPYPAVIVRQRVSLSKNLQGYLNSKFKGNFVNNNTFNKWSMYKMLSNNANLKNHLPETSLYVQPSDILRFLREHKSCYVKPLLGMEGKRINKIIEKEHAFIVKSHFSKQNTAKKFSTANELFQYCKQEFSPKKYIIQQPLNLEIIPNHVVDFRLVLIKNGLGKWINAGMISKYGSLNNIVSNYARGGKISLGSNLLKAAFNCTDDEQQKLLALMTDIAITAANEIEKHHFHICKYGIDIGIDTQQRIWLIEMNHRYLSDNVFATIGDNEKPSFIKENTLLYAKYLAQNPIKAASFPSDKEAK